MADPNPDFVNMDVMPTDDETREEQAEENEEANENVEATDPDKLPLAAGAKEHQEAEDERDRQLEEEENA